MKKIKQVADSKGRSPIPSSQLFRNKGELRLRTGGGTCFG